ncbi:hypothetical protein EMIT0324P_220013 [Pseudomonas chlororaphis]
MNMGDYRPDSPRRMLEKSTACTWSYNPSRLILINRQGSMNDFYEVQKTACNLNLSCYMKYVIVKSVLAPGLSRPRLEWIMRCLLYDPRMHGWVEHGNLSALSPDEWANIWY